MKLRTAEEVRDQKLLQVGPKWPNAGTVVNRVRGQASSLNSTGRMEPSRWQEGEGGHRVSGQAAGRRQRNTVARDAGTQAPSTTDQCAGRGAPAATPGHSGTRSQGHRAEANPILQMASL
jgi:hypothetical protein